MSDTQMGTCSCKNNSEANLVVAVKRGIFEMGCLAWIINLVLAIVTSGFWSFVLLGYFISRYFSPTYKCQFCNKSIEKEQLRSAAQQMMTMQQKMMSEAKKTQDLKEQDEQKKKDEIKNYRTLVFKKVDIIDRLEKISDSSVHKYFVDRHYEKLKSDIQMYIDGLEELNDKAFAKSTLDRLNSLKYKSDSHTEYSNTVLSKIDSLREDLKETEEKLKNFGTPKIDTTNLKTGWKIRPIRLVFMIFFALISAVYFIGIMTGSAKGATGEIIFMLFVLLSSVLVIINEYLWIKDYDKYKVEQERKRQEQASQNIIVEQSHNEELAKLQKLALQHPVQAALEEITIKYPDFHILSDDLNQAIS